FPATGHRRELTNALRSGSFSRHAITLTHRVGSAGQRRNASIMEQPVANVAALSAASTVVRSDGFIDAEIDQEIVALSIERGTCYGLNRVGSRIGNLLAPPVKVGDICANLVAQYRVDPDVCERDVLGLLEELRPEGLITTPPC